MRVVSVDLWEDAGSDCKVGCATSGLGGTEWMRENSCFGPDFGVITLEARVTNTFWYVKEVLELLLE